MKIYVLLSCLFISTQLLAQSWTPVANIPGGVHHPVTWGLQGMGYAVSGTDANNAPTDNVYQYNPTTDSWITLSDFPGSPRSFAIGTVYKGIGYIGFGASSLSLLRDLWSYNPLTGQWNILAPCPCAGRRHPSFVAVNDAIYVGLGDGAQGNYKDWWKYDILTNSWSQLPDLPGPPRHHPFQFVVNDQVFAGLGHGGNTIYKDWYRLDPVTDTWTQMADFPGEARVAGTQFDHAEKGYVLSGDGDNHSFMATGEFWEYDDITDSWNQLTPHPGRSRWAPGSFIINDEVYFIGGLDRSSQVLRTSAYKYKLPSTIGLNEEASLALKIYPNPANHWLKIETMEQFDHLELVNSTGQVVLKKGRVEQIELSHLPAGLYHLRVFKNERIAARHKLMVQ